MLTNTVLADGWKWSQVEGLKVRRSGGGYIKWTGDKFAYQPARFEGLHGQWIIESNDSLIILKLVALTHYVDELNNRVEGSLEIR